MELPLLVADTRITFIKNLPNGTAMCKMLRAAPASTLQEYLVSGRPAWYETTNAIEIIQTMSLLQFLFRFWPATLLK